MTNITDPLAAAGIRCYETVRGDSIAFEHEGKLCFGPSEKLCAFLSGSSESFLSDQEAENAIATLRVQQRQNPYRSTPAPIPTAGADTDNLTAILRRWEAERSAGQWEPEYSRKQLEGLR